MSLPVNPKQPSHKLTFAETVEVWKLHVAGHFPHRIAAHFDTDPARMYDVLKEELHRGSREEAAKQLQSVNPSQAAALRAFKFKEKPGNDNQRDLFSYSG